MTVKTLLLLTLMSVAASASAQLDRAGTWEFGFGLFESGSENTGGEGGSSLAVRSEVGYTLTGGYNFTNRLALLGEYSWSSPRYVAQLVLDGSSNVETISTRLRANTLHVKGVYYLFDSAFTPYVELGAGWTRIDSNVVSGPPTTGCWWDPWWGYICTQFFQTYRDTRFSYAASAGVSWDVTPFINVKASWGLIDVDTSSRTERFRPRLARVGAAWRF